MKLAREVKNHKEYNINEMREEEINEIVKINYNIKNKEYLKSIFEVAKGNVRLSMMISKLINEKNDITVLNNVFNIYHKYYSPIINEIYAEGETDLIKVAGILSYFKIIDLENEKEIESITANFAVERRILEKNLRTLYKLEIVDCYKNTTYKLTDQVMTTYLFYYVFMYKEYLSIYIILDKYYFEDSRNFFEIMKGVTSSFFDKDTGEKIKGYGEYLYEKSIINGKEAEILNNWCQIIVTQATLYLKRQIDNIVTKSDENIDENICVEILKNTDTLDTNLIIFRKMGNLETDENEIVVELILDYLLKKPELLSEVCTVIVNLYVYVDRREVSLYKRVELLETLYKKTIEIKKDVLNKLFIHISKKLLEVEYQQTNQTNNIIFPINTVQFRKSKELMDFRYKIFDYLVKINEFAYSNEIVEVLCSMYGGSSTVECIGEIMREELSKLYDVLKKILVNDKVEYFYNVGELLKQYRLHSIDNSSHTLLSGELWNLYVMILFGNIEDENVKLSYKDKIKFKNDCLKKYTFNLNFKKILETIDNYYSLLIEDNNESYSIRESYKAFIIYAFDTKKDDIEKIIVYELEYEKNLLQPLAFGYDIIEKAIDILGIERLLLIVENINDSIKKDYWLFKLYMEKNNIKYCKKNVKEILYIIKNMNKKNYPMIFNIVNSGNLNDGDIIEILKIINDKAKTEIEILNNINLNIISSKLQPLTKEACMVIKNLYLQALNNNINIGDYSLETFTLILKCDSNFLVEFMNADIYEYEFNFELFWTIPEVVENMDLFIDKMYIRNIGVIGVFKINELFKTQNKDIEKIQKEYIIKKIKDKKTNSNLIKWIFRAVAEKEEKFKLGIFKILFENNTDFETFKELSIFPNYKSWSGSEVPLLNKEKEYLEKIVDLCKGKEFLEHKAYLENKVKNKIKEIEMKKKEDFASRY